MNEQFGVDLSALSARQLLELDASIVRELSRRGLVRGNNKPLGDIVESIVHNARGGILEPNSTKSHDVTTRAGERIQVKARLMSKLSGQFSAFRSFGFTTAVFMVFEPKTLDMTWAREVAAAEVEAAGWSDEWTRSKTLTGSKVLSLGEDVTSEMRSAYDQLT